jgi:hypothetical protein
MKPYIKITVITFTTWLVFAIINGFLTGIFITITRHLPYDWALFIVIAFFISLLFSSPGFFIFWIILLISFANHIQQRTLFRHALSAGFVLSSIEAIACSNIFLEHFSSNKYILILLVIVSCITSIMMHFNYFKKIKTKNYEAGTI